MRAALLVARYGLALIASGAMAAQYRIVDLDPTGRYGGAEDVNENGWAVGSNGFHACLWRNGNMEDLGTLGDAYSVAHGLNSSGRVVGYSTIPGGGSAFVWENGRMSSLGGGEAWDVNDLDQIVGVWPGTSYGPHYACLWERGMVQILGSLGGNSVALAINNHSQIVGSSWTEPGVTSHAFLWESGVMRDIGTLGGRFSEARDVNNVGQVVGYCAGVGQSFLWENGSMRSIGTFEAWAINNLGQVVGRDGQGLPVLWEDGAVYDLPVCEFRTFAIIRFGVIRSSISE
ncbi:MAG: hypothetical protein M1274_14670 [Actinobacteria bacterium]|nr:hypothetical protein [Actinomycetota bacterium]